MNMQYQQAWDIACKIPDDNSRRMLQNSVWKVMVAEIASLPEAELLELCADKGICQTSAKIEAIKRNLI